MNQTPVTPRSRRTPPTRQVLLWCPPGSSFPNANKRTGIPAGGIPITYTGVQPFRLWTMYECTDEGNPPSLPMTPRHLHGAFLEDRVHDWNLNGTTLRYYSRVTSGGVWLLLEVPE